MKIDKDKEKELLKKLAELEHSQWMKFAKEMLKTENISEERKERWEKYFVSYKELPEDVKDLDREWVGKIIEIFEGL